jgi:hypothetical protein
VPDLTLQVDSHDPADLIIFISQRDGGWKQLGLAKGGELSAFPVSWTGLDPSGQLRLRADGAGREEPMATDLMAVRPGQTILWTLERGLEESSVALF